MRALDQWYSNNQNTARGLCYALEYKYTQDGLTSMSRLKGCDYQRSKFVADVSSRHGKFQVLLAFLHKVVRHPNDEYPVGDENYEEKFNQLGPIKTLEGSLKEVDMG